MRDALVEGALARLRPVVMTLLVGVVGLLPLALGWGEGTELLQPIAIAVIGGLVFSLFLTFLFMPAAYLLFNADSQSPTRGVGDRQCLTPAIGKRVVRDLSFL
ncbi:MAG: hypothetical protein AUJ92_03145 [Armatimonadetes bacterium CG2_30_59_28]|nr:MAG: hypothetical protein AUJ92_03145 [Armatimonadetes bacterium CG2_30_59_28]PIU64638.1 MAG: hypothetical protein COS85_11760 [Armatimonadetes bacterium CG07_land_8_20_14_0_80_59_28]PIY39056.1 MAG: hypothetical protein COZ05_19775 [Armatimonadetes bacterium CG_4_10_14_3_um_filter_59_10]